MYKINTFVWSEQTQFSYIQECKKIYESYVFNKPSKKDVVLDELYIEGYENGALKLAYDEFKAALTTSNSKWSNRYNFLRATQEAAFYSRHKIAYREGMKYVRKEAHQKKMLSQEEISKQDWREKKGFKRDKSKAGGRLDGCPPWLKRACHKTHRSWIRDCIKNENYDELGSWNSKRKDMFDPWMWD